jgi:arsenate reductase
MAEALWESLSQSINSQQQQWKAASAGSKPSGYVHPLAVEVMREIEIDISNFQSESVEKFRDDNFDLVVTVCNSAKEACPFFPSKNEPLHWPFDDPADATGTDEEKKVVFRRVRDEIKTKIESYLKSLES